MACVAELLLPHGGLFSSVSSANLEQFSQLALAAVAASAGVAAVSKPRIGSQLREVHLLLVFDRKHAADAGTFMLAVHDTHLMFRSAVRAHASQRPVALGERSCHNVFRMWPFSAMQAVHSSLTALKRSKSSLSSLDVDLAVDFVFDSVFSREMLSELLDEHEWI